MSRFRILELCKERGITQKDLAAQIGMTPVGLAKAAGGNPTVDTLEKIAEALGVPVTELFVPTPTDTLRCPHCGGVIKIEKGE